MSENATHAAAQRADYVRALNEERDQCERAGKKERVKAIDAELARVGGKPAERRAPESTTAKKTSKRG